MRFALLAGLILVSGWLYAENPPVALPDGSTAPNFTLTDLDGVTHTLYDYLDQGKTVVIDFSATWCGPCWNYHNTHILNDLYDQYGPDGTDEVMVFFVEGDPSTPVSSLYGGPGSQGNWVAGTSYPIMDDPTGSVSNSFAISYFPTLYAICPDRKIYEPGQVQLQTWVNWITSCSLDESHFTVNADCFGEASGSIDLSVSGGYGNISYHWSNGTSTQDLNNVAPGVYACTITEGQGHSIQTPMLTVGSPPPLVPQTNYVINVLCAGEATGSAAVTAVGGTPGYLYQWSNGMSGQVITNVAGGNYTVTVTDDNGCEAMHTVFVGEPAPLQSTPFSTGDNCGNGDGTLLVSVQGGTFPYLYDIGDGPQPNPFFLNLSAGDYTITTYDAAGCQTEITATVPDISGPTADAGPTMQVDCANTTVTLDGTASADGVSIAYLWTTTDGNILSGADTATPIVDAAGTYTLEVLDQATNCISTATVTVSANTDVPTADAAVDVMLTCLTTEVTLDGSASSQGADFSYEWTTVDGHIVSGESTLFPVVDAPGTYAIEVLNLTNGCAATETVVVLADVETPSAEAGTDGLLTCATTSTLLDGTASAAGPQIQYSWSTVDGLIVGPNDGLMVEVAAPGIYMLEVTNTANGCVGTDVVLVTEDIVAPTAEAGADGLLTCAVLELSLDASASSGGANFSYNWTTPDGNIVSGANTTNPLVDAPGLYTLEVFNNSNGCVSSDVVQVLQDAQLPLADAGPAGLLTCANTTLVLDGTGSSGGANINYQWTTADGNILSGAATASPTIDAPGTYTLEVLNEENDCSAAASVTIEAIAPVIAATDTVNDVDCAGAATGSATVTTSEGTAPYIFAWPTGGTEATETGLEAGTYVVTITDTYNCVDEVTVVIHEPPVLGANATATGESSAGANDGTASAGPSGGTGLNYTFLWSTGATASDISGLAPGTYTVTVTDENNCTVVETVTVNAFNCLISAAIVATDVSCNGGADGVAALEILAGAEPYAIEWSSGGSGSTETGLAAGSYTVSITDGNNCPTTANVTIQEPTVLLLAEENIQTISCNGAADGTATVLADGGTPGYSYLWSNGTEGPSAVELVAGTYSVTATDANGCSELLEIDLTEPDPLTVAINATNETGNGASDGTAAAMPAGGTSGYTYMWNTGATTAAISDLPPGEYTVEVTDANGCLSSQSVIILEFACGLIEAITEVENVSCAGEGDGVASVSLEGGSAPYTYAWSNSATTQTVQNLTPGSYSVTVTDDNDCPIVAEVLVAEPPAVVLELLEQQHVSCSPSPTGTATVTANGGDGDFSYSWSNGLEGASVEGLEPGWYAVTATDGAGCVESLSVEILFLADETAPEVFTQDIAVTLDPQSGMVSITPEMIDNGSTDECAIVELSLDQSTFDCSMVGVQTVLLSATDAGGNVTTAPATVVVQDNLPVLTVASPPLVALDPVTGTFQFDEADLILEAGDDCGVESLTISQTVVDCSFIGGGLITVVLTDVNGHSVEAEIEVFASDITAPAITCPEDITTSDCSLVIEYASPTATDNCGVESLTQVSGLGSGQVFPVGTTIEAYEAIDQHGNVSNCTFSVTVENSMEWTFLSQETCPNTADGTASIDVSGGTPGYTYEWSTGATSAAITDLVPGIYTVTATDALGCTIAEEIVVGSTPEVMIQVLSVTDETNGGQNGSIDITLEGGVEPLVVTWYDENQNPVSGNVDLLNVGAGSYTAEVVDGFGCVYTMEEPVVINNVTGLETIQHLTRFELSPNPTPAQCRLDIQLDAPALIELCVYRSDGQLVSRQNFGMQVGLTEEINLSGQAAGVYFLKVRVGDRWLSERIVLMK